VYLQLLDAVGRALPLLLHLAHVAARRLVRRAPAGRSDTQSERERVRERERERERETESATAMRHSTERAE